MGKKLNSKQKQFWNRLRGHADAQVVRQLDYMVRYGILTQQEYAVLIEKAYHHQPHEMWGKIIDFIRQHSFRTASLPVKNFRYYPAKKPRSKKKNKKVSKNRHSKR